MESDVMLSGGVRTDGEAGTYSRVGEGRGLTMSPGSKPCGSVV